MKNHPKRIAALILALALLAGLGWVANGLLGNPVSRMLAVRTARAYLEETCPDPDYVLEEVRYSFKEGGYHAYLAVPGSEDRRFTLGIGMGGRLHWDNYDSEVAGRWTTARRLDQAYRELGDRVLESAAFPYETHIAFTTLEFCPREALGAEGVPDYAMVQEELELDGVYDMAELGAQCGHLVLYLRVPGEHTAQREAEILADVRERLEAGGVPFRDADLVLWPLDEETFKKVA